jgi:long-chain acyl-CoA synthetase
MSEAVLNVNGAVSNRPWLQSYPPGVPAEMNPVPYSSLAQMIEDNCRKFANRDAYVSMGKTITFGDLERLSVSVGGWLQSRGLQKGDRVAVMMPNILQYPVVVAAVLRAGLVVVNVNPLYTPRELEHQLKDSGAKAIFVLENFANTVAEVVANTQVKTVVVASMGDMLGLKGHIVNFVVRRVKKLVPAWSIPGSVSFKSVLSAGAKLTPVQISASDMAFLQYTGGTTGVSKGAVLLHSNLLANISQNRTWMTPILSGPLPEQLIYVCALPLYHIFALTVNMFMALELGGLNIMIANPRDIPTFVKEISAYKFNVFPALNTLFNALANNADFVKLDFSGLVLSLGGGMAVQRPVAEQWQAVTGCAVAEGYGLSETSPVATSNCFGNAGFTGTIGVPIPSTEVDIRDDDGKSVPIGTAGEICIRGPQVMAGYWNRPEETANVMTSDGYFRSGDIGIMMENGYIKIVDRKKDMILVSGFNVFPNEIEEFVVTHPGVLECAAVGVPDKHSGEAVKLFVVRKDPQLTEADIKAHCAKGLTNYKRPKYVEFRDALPKSNVGKILRKELRG